MIDLRDLLKTDRAVSTKQMCALAAWAIQHATHKEWSVQGFGFARMYLNRGNESTRIHVWDSALRIPGVSDIHTHPWSFDSTIIAGRLGNIRYKLGAPGDQHFLRQKIKAGEGAFLIGEPEQVFLRKEKIEEYGPGDRYFQSYEEIHCSAPMQDFTVTIVSRVVKVENPDHAFVFWPDGEEWGNAAPRQATGSEWARIVNGALCALDPVFAAQDRLKAAGLAAATHELLRSEEPK